MTLLLPRRRLLLGAAAGICAPAVVRAQNIIGSGVFGTSGAFSVASMPGLVAWWKADGTLLNGSAAPAANGQNLSQWNDSFGSNNLLPSDFGAGSTGKYLSAGLNGKPTVFFDTNNSGGMYAPTFPMGNNITELFVYAYLSTTASATLIGGLLSYASSPHANIFNVNDFYLQNTGPSSCAVVISSTQEDILASHAVSTGIRLGMQWKNGVGGSVIYNGVVDTPTGSTAMATVTNGTFFVAISSVGGGGIDCFISELVVCNQEPDSTTLANLDTYLQRWN